MAEDDIKEIDQNSKETEADNEDNVLSNNVEDEYNSSEDENYEVIEEVANRSNRVREHNLKLEERCKLLKNSLETLRAKLVEEKDLWKLEIDEAMKCGKQAEGDANSVQFYYSSNSNSSDSIHDLYEYEHNLLAQQDYFARYQAQQRAKIRRQIALNNYQRKLLEVESMCNLELLRVKQNFQYLRPLRLITSDWNLKNDGVKGNECGDYTTNSEKLDLPKICQKDRDEDNKMTNDLSTTLESLGNKIQTDVNEMFEKLRNQCKSIPEMQISSSSIFQIEDESNSCNEVTWTYSQDYTIPSNIL